MASIVEEAGMASVAVTESLGANTGSSDGATAYAPTLVLGVSDREVLHMKYNDIDHPFLFCLHFFQTPKFKLNDTTS